MIIMYMVTLACMIIRYKAKIILTLKSYNDFCMITRSAAVMCMVTQTLLSYPISQIITQMGIILSACTHVIYL